MPEPVHELPITTGDDVVRVRQAVRARASAARLSLVDQTKLITAASELARNAVIYGGGGHMDWELLEEGARRGLRLIFRDEGPGIPDVKLAMTDGWTSGGGLGLGLTGAKRLVDEFSLESAPGAGTRVTICKWT